MDGEGGASGVFDVGPRGWCEGQIGGGVRVGVGDELAGDLAGDGRGVGEGEW